MTNEPLYYRIPEEGKHPANSKKNPGAISGAALDDITNKPSGASDFMPVGMTEAEYIQAQQMSIVLCDLLRTGLDYTLPRLGHWFCTSAYPHLVKVTIPAAKKKVSEVWNQVHKTKTDMSDEKKYPVSSSANYPAITLPSDLDEAYQNYTVNMSSEEAQKELFEAFVFYLMSMKKLQRLSQARIIDSNGNVINGDEVVRLMAKPAVLRGVNHMLSSNPALWEEWQAAALSDALGRKLVQNDHFIPIRRSELLSMTSAIKAEQSKKAAGRASSLSGLSCISKTPP